MKDLFTLSLSAFLIFFYNSCSVAQEKTVERSFEGIDEISANFSSGDLTIERSNSSTVEVTVDYTYDEDNYVPEFDQRGSNLRLKEEFTGRNVMGWSKWTLVVPEGLDIDVNSGSGDIFADGLAVNIKSNSGSGDVSLNSIEGEFDVNTGSGDIEIESHSGDISVNTGSGDVEISDTKGELEINSGSGDIDVTSVAGEFDINTGSGEIKADQITVLGSSRFNSGSGDAEVSLAADLDHHISINSGSGNAELDFNGLEISGVVVMKANKRRGEIEAPFEFDEVEEEEQGNQIVVKKTVKLGSKDIEIQIGTGSGKAIIRE